MPGSSTKYPVDTPAIASELRVVLGQLMRRLRAQHGFPISHGTVLGRLDRDGPQSVSDLASAERMRPQSMAQTVADLEAQGQVERRPDPADRRRALVALTAEGRAALLHDRGRRDGWLAGAIAEQLSPAEQDVLRDAVALLRRLTDA
ncbi:MAG TPA: MarR family winged helix-turn-helix transcriptional regulator [Solirubrobacteraceae bacterium]|nr:MarR family winged helix-turn-helix transcriptional regulator [Solirubrobacteraceae bacterium]